MKWTKVCFLMGAFLILWSIPAFGQVVISSGTVTIGAQQTIKGAPYVVVQETEQSQKLGDGTNIVIRSQTRLYRDSSGRTRRESHVNRSGIQSDEPDFVQLDDPIAGTTYLLRVQQRTAQLMTPMMGRKPLVNPNVAQKPVTNSEGVRPKSTSEDLGSQSFIGVLADGTRTTTIFPEGYFGNDRPIQALSERWVSNELGLTMLEKHSDPRFGEIITRVTSLDRAEPDPALFQIPPDYIVQEPNTK